MRTPTKKSTLTRRGIRREFLIERLVERWLFERSAETLYALALKHLKPGDPLTDEVARFRDVERLHREMLEALLGEFGREPRAEPATPRVNITASKAAALLEAARGSELTRAGVVEILLSFEVMDAVEWEILAELGQAADLEDEWLRSFRVAEREETEQIHILRAHLERLDRDALSAPAD
jgi:hypothetical protein